VSAAALSPEGALRWLQSLSIDLRATVVLDASGAVLAGDPAFGARAAAGLAAASAGDPASAAAPPADGPVGEAPHAVRDGDMLAVRAGRHAVAAALGPRALERVARCDLAAAAAALGPT
jgi:hypothetical protein